MATRKCGNIYFGDGGGGGGVTFIETLPHLIPQPTQLSPLRELPPAELVDDYTLTDDLPRDARDYTAVLDFNVNIPAEHANADSVDGGPGMEQILEQIRDVTRKDLLIPPGEFSSGRALSVETLPGGTLPETSSPSSAPHPMPAGDQAAPVPSPASSEVAARRTPRPAPRSEPALTRARAASVPPRRQTRSGTASLAAFFEQRAMHNLRSLALYTNVETQDIAHHLENASLFAEYAYVSTASAENHSGGWNKLKVPNTFKEAMSLPQTARWKAAADKEIPRLKKHGVYELVPASSVPAGQKVVGSRWVNKIKADDFFRSRLVVLGWAQVPGIDYDDGTFTHVRRLQCIRMMLAIAAELDYEVLMLDVQTAFLNADVEEEVFVKMAPGYETYDKTGVPFVMKRKRRVSTVFDRAPRTGSAPWTIISQTSASARSSQFRAPTCSKTRPALPS